MVFDRGRLGIAPIFILKIVQFLYIRRTDKVCYIEMKAIDQPGYLSSLYRLAVGGWV